jgi:lysophospholipase L1-like esterase
MFIGDSKTAGSVFSLATGGFQTPLIEYLGPGAVNVGALVAIRNTPPYSTTSAAMEEFPAFAAAQVEVPDYVFVNLGTNDLPLIRDASLTEGTWEMGDLLDAIHAEWPSAKVKVARPLRTDYVAEYTTLNDTWIPNVLASRSAWASTGVDERDFLTADLRDDTTHPTGAGYVVTARWMAWEYLGLIP